MSPEIAANLAALQEHLFSEDSSLWTHGVIQRLQRDGYPFKVFSNPLRGVAHDAAYLRSLLDTIDGAVITQARDDPKVKGLIYAGSELANQASARSRHSPARI